MAQTGQMGSRQREILTAIVETFIATGEPVGSQAVARDSREGLSPATVRNVMAELADAGYLEQPHTSAGRVPTVEAYRYYVEQLSGRTRLSAPDEDMIRVALQGVSDTQEFLERTSHVLSLISRGVGVAVSTGGSNALEHIHFSRLGDHKVLAVVVARSGLVRDRVFRLEPELSQAELDLAARYVNENFRGWTLQAMREEVARRIQAERSHADQLMQSLQRLYAHGALDASRPEHEVFVEGAANLVGEQDSERLRQLLRTLEEKEKVARLLEAYVDTRQEAVRVVIGLEEALPEMRNFVLIGAPARVGEEVMGSLAVIGPTRIDYEHTITAVSYLARLFDKILNDEEQ